MDTPPRPRLSIALPLARGSSGPAATTPARSSAAAAAATESPADGPAALALVAFEAPPPLPPPPLPPLLLPPLAVQAAAPTSHKSPVA